ncbi:uncharacterized protein N7482_010244 [Penicillium canariense]|uniref:MIT domain-containing protein n=1 Tax=Penicillium canariense TaxID=189055 RepID=A0A9W9HKF1_9EURO|nr:uncharacterized protein N7482_010244 [Penicillium canariense]KAJ5150992.1 hypothetical protein N7482_010244 [Penicillium canariense]
MLHRSALEDEPRSFHSRHPSAPHTEPPSGPPSHRPASRSSRPASRNRMVKPSGAVTPTGLGMVSESVPDIAPALAPISPIKEGLGSLNRWSQSTTSSKSPSEYNGHHRGSSKRSISGHSPHRTPGLGELPELSLPELRASEMFPADLPTSHLDLSFTASSHIFHNSSIHEARDLRNIPSDHDPAATRISDGAVSADGEGDGENRQHGQTQKAMLSKALQKANTAVLLDNAANFEGAMEAYTDACQLLQWVMLRSNGGDEEKLKLQEIVSPPGLRPISLSDRKTTVTKLTAVQRDTYMIRIAELQRMDFPLPDNDGKALPERPLSQESYGELLHASAIDGFHIDSQHSSAHSSLAFQAGLEESRSLPSEAIPPRRQSLRPSLPSGRTTPAGLGNNLAAYNEQFLESSAAAETNESTSWLDTIDESGASSPSSANSKASSVYLRRRTSRRLSTDTEAEFDAALDAAVEAAYDEGLEPVLEYKEEESEDILANAHRNIELAKQRVREAEREAEAAMNRGREFRHIQEQAVLENPVGRNSDYLDEEAEEEERLLEEMTKGYVMDDFEFGIQSKSALPRESDSSNLSGRTWESSAASNITGTGATLSTLTEDDDRVQLPSSSPPNAALPPVPASTDFPRLPPQRASFSQPPPPPSMGPPPVPGVRARRLSGQEPRELKIETSTRARTGSSASGIDPFTTPSTAGPPPPLPKDDSFQDPPRASTPSLRTSLHPSKRNPSVGSVVDHINLAKARTHDDDEPGLPPLPLSARPMGKVPSAPDGLDRAHANSKSFRTRNVSVPITDTASGSPTTPWSGSFPTLDTQKAVMVPGVPVMPTPTAAHFTQNGLPTGGLNLFDCNIHSPSALGRPNSLVPNAPLPLEPCPESFLLRPFWLMRCLYQTIAHPHGGYLSAKLFIPRDVWRVKNVKIKALEDKVSNCDLLTAALLKLAQVDTYDADAVLEEMQSFESVLDQVQIGLSKKLGHEVGVHTAVPVFKPNAAPDDAAHAEPAPSRTSGTSNKSYLPTWKRLRAKTSGIGTAASTVPAARDSNKEHLTLNSVPMTAAPISQARRSVTSLDFSGPNAHYMGALARLFDAAQVLDQIAQQVEDPGLKHSSPTHVGLELSTRHAAEFFGFYVCRFALADVGLMLDKFIKRGSEWVLI